MFKMIATLIVLTLMLSAHAEKPYCVAHRALGFGELENSMSALIAASKSEVTAIEFDLLHTKDGKTIVYHDKILKRNVKGSRCPKGEEVSKLLFKVIRSQCKLSNGEVIPTLDEALQSLSQYDSKLFIEFKDLVITENDFETIKKLYQNRPAKASIISFKTEILDEVIKKRKSDPFFKKIKTVLLKKYGYFGNVKRFDVLDAKYIHKSRVRKLQKRGMEVGVYTKDSKEKIIKYLKKGVDFITTNKTSRCEAIINKMFN